MNDADAIPEPIEPTSQASSMTELSIAAYIDSGVAIGRDAERTDAIAIIESRRAMCIGDNSAGILALLRDELLAGLHRRK